MTTKWIKYWDFVPADSAKELQENKADLTETRKKCHAKQFHHYKLDIKTNTKD